MPEQSHEYYMKLALLEAKKAFEEQEVPVGAIIVYEDKIIAKAYNQVQKLKDPTAHAEVLAITSAAYALGSKYLFDCSIYVTVEPCIMCAGAIFWSKMKSLIYGCGDNKYGFKHKCDPLVFNQNMLVQNDVLALESKELMLQFFKNRRQ